MILKMVLLRCRLVVLHIHVPNDMFAIYLNLTEQSDCHIYQIEGRTAIFSTLLVLILMLWGLRMA